MQPFRAVSRRRVSALNEDYGIVTVESFMCAKPVVTCRDSGGVAELVRDGENGFVTEPTPEALALAMRAVMDDRNRAPFGWARPVRADACPHDVARRRQQVLLPG